ncbi:glycosyl hydrolase [Iodidimonas muriae]|uniref:beta-glucosidase n=1 Tax=Iodidimonas muriae TaxID=261467 RepID=A0ABQ2LDU3_9PROT|nr:glycoside hydrolase family 3 N-terminal domain-containing protein [Iodidimonas muriae]GER07955.1 glycosyl hydrolase [Kordiimonadales bacterium JCM 17843]GGO11784.1 glycosyl hydrolase [Iodidimonas muriae]
MSIFQSKSVKKAALLCVLTTVLAVPAWGSESKAIARNADEAALVEDLLARMTLEEKLGQLAQPRGRWGDTGPEVQQGGEEDVRAGRVGSYLGVYGADYTRRLQEIAVDESRLGIPLLFAHDVIHGFRTIFPVPLGEAASFDHEAVERAARIAAEEATAYGLHWTYAPMVDIARDPRWGRIVEGAGESPYLGSEMAVARVRGFQGQALDAPDTMLATAKHFVAYGGAEGGRDYNTVDISERTLHEIYLPPFQAAVDAGVQSVMAAFNEVGGIPMHAHGDLINGTLRKEWGFDGILVSDYTGVAELIPHGVAANREEAGILALEAGVDIDMVSNIYTGEMLKAVEVGKLDEAVVDEAVRRVLRAKVRLGLFDDPYRYSDKAREKAHTLKPEYRAAARDLARKSLVLLKNEGDVLPLSKQTGTIAVIGPLADNRRVMLGGWAAAGQEGDAITPLEGIRAAVSSDTKVLYAKGAEIDSEDRSGFDEAVDVARKADVVLLFLGEHHDMSAEANNRTSLDLPGVQKELAQAVHASGKPVVAVLFSGRPLAVTWLSEEIPALVEAWFPGIEAGHAIADTLFGDYNPAGRLPVSFPRNVGQIPIYHNHKNTGRPPSQTEKYTSKYLDVPWTPLYPFGHGLSYTTFGYDGLSLDKQAIAPDGSVEVTVTVTNNGARAGEEVVQLYLRDDVASVTRPVKELRGFERIHLAPGESRKVQFHLDFDDLAFYGKDMRRVVEPGTFTVFVGGNSVDLLETQFKVVTP